MKGRTLFAAGILCFAAESALALEALTKCEFLKIKEAGKYALCRLKADAKGVKQGEAPDYQKCDEKFSARWSKIEAKAAGDCPVPGDASFIEGQVGGFTTAIASFIGGDGAPTCGNGVIEPGEQCEVGNLGGDTCVQQGFVGGELSCGVDCTFDDSACYAMRFTDNGDGTITDNETGLIWEKKVRVNNITSTTNCPDAVICPDPHNGQNRYTWPLANSLFLGQLNDLSGGGSSCFAGSCDWRLPTIHELLTLVDYSTFLPAISGDFNGPSCFSCTDVTDIACNCTASDLYWTSSPIVLFSGAYWGVDFYGGDSEGSFSHMDFRVRAVRGGF